MFDLKCGVYFVKSNKNIESLWLQFNCLHHTETQQNSDNIWMRNGREQSNHPSGKHALLALNHPKNRIVRKNRKIKSCILAATHFELNSKQQTTNRCACANIHKWGNYPSVFNTGFCMAYRSAYRDGKTKWLNKCPFGYSFKTQRWQIFWASFEPIVKLNVCACV